MKKFIALGGIAAMGTFGFLGLGSTVASAAAPTTRQQVCSAATTLVANQTVANATDNAVLANANTAAAAAAAALATDVTNYLTTADKVINDVDGTPAVLPAVQATDTAAFNAAVNATVADFTASSAANVAKSNAEQVQKTDAFKMSVYQGLQSKTCPQSA